MQQLQVQTIKKWILMFHDHHNYRQHQSPQRSGKKNRNIQASIMIDPTLDSNKEDDGDGTYEEVQSLYSTTTHISIC